MVKVIAIITIETEKLILAQTQKRNAKLLSFNQTVSSCYILLPNEHIQNTGLLIKYHKPFIHKL